MATRSGRGGSRISRAATRLAAAGVVVLVVLGAIAFGISKLWQASQRPVIPDGCDVATVSLDLDQAAVASTMIAVTIKRDLPERAAVLLIAAGLQESKLRNLEGGDRDSVGVLQQRPSQGWGTVAQISDVRYATGKFLDALVKQDGWQTKTLAVAIQEVQRSADGEAYAKHEPDAQLISDAFTGRTPAAVSCRFSAPTVAATPAVVIARLRLELPVAAPTAAGVTISVPGAAWPTAGWLVGHADQYGLISVSYAGRQWHRSKGWQDAPTATVNMVTATLAQPAG